MKSTIIEGIPDSKIKRLKKHLLKVERLTGQRLKKTPRRSPNDCPIENFAPLKNKQGERMAFLAQGLLYFSLEPYTSYILYEISDYSWWESLWPEQRKVITRHIQQWIKEGKKL